MEYFDDGLKRFLDRFKDNFNYNQLSKFELLFETKCTLEKLPGKLEYLINFHGQ